MNTPVVDIESENMKAKRTLSRVVVLNTVKDKPPDKERNISRSEKPEVRKNDQPEKTTEQTQESESEITSFKAKCQEFNEKYKAIENKMKSHLSERRNFKETQDKIFVGFKELNANLKQKKVQKPNDSDMESKEKVKQSQSSSRDNEVSMNFGFLIIVFIIFVVFIIIRLSGTEEKMSYLITFGITALMIQANLVKPLSRGLKTFYVTEFSLQQITNDIKEKIKNQLEDKDDDFEPIITKTPQTKASKPSDSKKQLNTKARKSLDYLSKSDPRFQERGTIIDLSTDREDQGGNINYKIPISLAGLGSVPAELDTDSHL